MSSLTWKSSSQTVSHSVDLCKLRHLHDIYKTHLQKTLKFTRTHLQEFTLGGPIYIYRFWEAPHLHLHVFSKKQFTSHLQKLQIQKNHFWTFFEESFVGPNWFKAVWWAHKIRFGPSRHLCGTTLFLLRFLWSQRWCACGKLYLRANLISGKRGWTLSNLALRKSNLRANFISGKWGWTLPNLACSKLYLRTNLISGLWTKKVRQIATPT